MNLFIAKDTDSIYAKRTQLEGNYIERTLVNLLQLGNNDKSKERKTASAQLLETTWI